MNLKNFLYFVATLLAIVMVAEVFLFLTGTKLLASELIIAPGEPFPDDQTVKIFGDYHAENQNSLICKYFNGRKFVFRMYKYSPINKEGVDSCPAYLKPRQ